MTADTDSRTYWTAELKVLIGELREAHWTVSMIAQRTGVTTRRVQQIIAEMKQPPTPESQLHPLLVERIIHFAKRNECCTWNT